MLNPSHNSTHRPKFKRGFQPKAHGYVGINRLKCENAWKSLCDLEVDSLTYRDVIAKEMGVSSPTSTLYRRLFDHLGLIEDIPGVYDAHKTYYSVPAVIIMLSQEPSAFREEVSTDDIIDDIWIGRAGWIEPKVVLIPHKHPSHSLNKQSSVRFAHRNPPPIDKFVSHVFTPPSIGISYSLKRSETNESFKRAERADDYLLSDEITISQIMDTTGWSRAKTYRRIDDGEIERVSRGRYRLHLDKPS